MTTDSVLVGQVCVLYLKSLSIGEVDCPLCAIYPTSVPRQPVHAKYHLYPFYSQHNQFYWKHDSLDLYGHTITCTKCFNSRPWNLHAHGLPHGLGLHPTSIHK